MFMRCAQGTPKRILDYITGIEFQKCVPLKYVIYLFKRYAKPFCRPVYARCLRGRGGSFFFSFFFVFYRSRV